MKSLQGTWLGAALDDNRMSFYGWTEMSYNASTASRTNQPVVWADRANRAMLQQHWMRLERSVITSGTSDPSFGFRGDLLVGTDYRFTLPRGLLNSQLDNAMGDQNLYGVDPISFYGQAYIPNIGRGLDIKVGRIYCPFGAESLEAVSTPLASRSYAFNWCPPFTHTGVMATLSLGPDSDWIPWTIQLGIVNGNDVFIDPSMEARFMGSLKYAFANKLDTVTLGTSLGRGKFNDGEPYAPATVGLMTEPAGRNNINVFDIVYNHIFGLAPSLSYTLEGIYGYQTNVPANVVGGIIKADNAPGTAHWWSIVNYLNYKFTDRFSVTGRAEVFEDVEGQRTGFNGVYTGFTLGCQYVPHLGSMMDRAVILRPEVRYDRNNQSTPFETKPDIFTATMDLIIRW